MDRKLVGVAHTVVDTAVEVGIALVDNLGGIPEHWEFHISLDNVSVVAAAVGFLGSLVDRPAAVPGHTVGGTAVGKFVIVASADIQQGIGIQCKVVGTY